MKNYILLLCLSFLFACKGKNDKAFLDNPIDSEEDIIYKGLLCKTEGVIRCDPTRTNLICGGLPIFTELLSSIVETNMVTIDTTTVDPKESCNGILGFEMAYYGYAKFIIDAKVISLDDSEEDADIKYQIYYDNHILLAEVDQKDVSSIDDLTIEGIETLHVSGYLTFVFDVENIHDKYSYKVVRYTDESRPGTITIIQQ